MNEAGGREAKRPRGGEPLELAVPVHVLWRQPPGARLSRHSAGSGDEELHGKGLLDACLSREVDPCIVCFVVAGAV